MVEEKISSAEQKFDKARKTFGLIAGPLVFFVFLFYSFMGQNSSQGNLAAVVLLVVIFWITEAIPIPVTALLGPTLCVLLGVEEIGEIFAPFAHPVIFLMMGTFIIGQGMYSHGLDRVIASAILRNKWVGGSAVRLLFTFGFISWFLSMWLSNTATAAMLIPIAMSVVGASEKLTGTRRRYAANLILMIAFSASLGGIATPIGTPPNLIAVGMIEKYLGRKIYFFQWMEIALPVSIALFAILFIVMKTGVSGEGKFFDIISGSMVNAVPVSTLLNKGQRNVLSAFLITVSLWVFPGMSVVVLGEDSLLSQFLVKTFPEAVPALIGAGLLFLLPVNWKEREFTLSWKKAASIDWGTILLFGGGLSIGNLMFKTGLASSIGEYLVAVTAVKSLFSVTLLFSLFATILTETASNTASANMIIPIVIAVSAKLGINPIIPAVAACISTSLAFTLPVSTPPNAIAYGSGCVPITTMVKKGIIIDIAGAVVIIIMATTFFQVVIK